MNNMNLLYIIVNFIKKIFNFFNKTTYDTSNYDTSKIHIQNKDNGIITYKRNIRNYVTIQEQDIICKWALDKKNNIVSRHNLKTCQELYDFDKYTQLNDLRYYNENKTNCYGCNNLYRKSHPVYVFSCFDCGDKFQENRTLTRDLTNYISVVIGARTKIGHQIVIKLLDAGSIVYGTTRYPKEAEQNFKKYDKWPEWSEKLKFIEFDLDTDNIEETMDNVIRKIDKSHIDILINCAAQTIRTREKNKNFLSENHNRYLEPRFVNNIEENSWDLKIESILQSELEEVHRINSIAPFIIIKKFLPLLKESNSERPYIINVHAREGIFNVMKSEKHIHTNMAKASLAMLTKCISESRIMTKNKKKVSVHGCDPGWISVDEYYSDSRPWLIPPLDEIDGAARILYPIFKNLSSSSKTRRHFDQMMF